RARDLQHVAGVDVDGGPLHGGQDRVGNVGGPGNAEELPAIGNGHVLPPGSYCRTRRWAGERSSWVRGLTWKSPPNGAILRALFAVELEATCAPGPWTPTASASRRTSTSRCSTARRRSTTSRPGPA